MKISDILEQVRPAFSFEFFPPKDTDGFDQLFKTIDLDLNLFSSAMIVNSQYMHLLHFYLN